MNDTAHSPGTSAPGRTAGSWLRAFIIALTVFALLGLSGNIWAYRAHLGHLEAEEIRVFKEAATEGTRQLNDTFLRVKAVADELAQKIETEGLASSSLKEVLAAELASHTFLRSIGIAYGAFEYASDTRQFARGLTRTDTGFEENFIDQAEHYLEPTEDNSWFHQPMTKGATWIEPYFDPVASLTVVEYCAPFYRHDAAGKKRAAGIVYADLSLPDVRSLLSRIDFGGGGYGMLLSKAGRYVSHPLEERSNHLKSALEDPVVRKSPALSAAMASAIRGETVFQEFFNDLTRKRSLVYFQPIPANGWPFGVVTIKDFDYLNADFIRRSLITIVLWSMMFLFLFFVTIIRAHEGNESKLWLTVVVFALLTLTAIMLVWYLSLTYTPYQNPSFFQIHDRPSLKKIEQSLSAKARDLDQPAPVFIPTGFFLQAVNFESSNDVRLTGIIWQKYTIGAHDGINRGFDFPEATDLSQTEKYRVRQGNTETIGWTFTATLRQQFDYARYPLDSKDVWIRTVHADFGKNIVLVPDLEAYPILNPTALPGIEENLVLQGWDPDVSFFNYGFNQYSTDFGIAGMGGKRAFPELYFTLILKRNFLAPFITYVLPILIIACILFTVLLMSTRDEKKNEMFQFSITAVIGTCSGLFFSVLVAHSQLRGAVAVNQVMYLEYFCFVLYIAILGVAANAFLFGLDTPIDLVRQRDNLFPKLLFWPAFLGTMLLVTVHTFL